MPTIQNILCPTDFSDSAEHAVSIAIELAQRFDAQVCLFHAYQLPVYAVPQVGAPGAAPTEMSREMPHRLDEMLEVEREKHARPGVSIATELVEGVAYQQIVDYATEWGADLIVMGTHGRTGLAHLLIGSVAERVVRTSRTPVLTVRKPSA